MAELAPALGLDAVLVSPLLRSLETAAKALGTLEESVEFRVCPSAREVPSARAWRVCASVSGSPRACTSHALCVPRCGGKNRRTGASFWRICDPSSRPLPDQPERPGSLTPLNLGLNLVCDLGTQPLNCGSNA